MVSRAAITGAAAPAGTVARHFWTGRQPGAGSPSSRKSITARAATYGKIAAARALAARSIAEDVRNKARAAESECQSACRRSSPFRPNGRRCLHSGLTGGLSLVGRRSGTVKHFPTAGIIAIASNPAFSSDTIGRNSSGRSRSRSSSSSRSRSSSSSSSSSNHGSGDGDGAAVVEHGTQKRLVAARGLEAGHVVFSRVGGVLVSEATRHSVQVGEGMHLEVDNDMKFFDHACEPNCQLEVVMDEATPTGGEARRPFLRVRVRAPRVDENEALSIDYNAMEVDMSSPFDCNCGAERCRGRVSGFANLPPVVQREYLDERWTGRRIAPTPASTAAAGGVIGTDGAVADGWSRAAARPPPLTGAAKQWAKDNITTPL